MVMYPVPKYPVQPLDIEAVGAAIVKSEQFASLLKIPLASTVQTFPP